ncbi:MAG TPA: GntR family transcriptional regulator [Chloroflexota bacterium]
MTDLGYSTKVELVYRDLRERIVNGVLLPGERLYLQTLADERGVSTVPVREALRRLESEGLVKNQPHTGATVAALDVEKIEVHFMIRAALEGLAARLATNHMTPALLEQLALEDEELRRLAATDELLTWNERNTHFYRRILDCCQSPDLVAMINLQRDRSPLLRHFPEVLAERAAEQNVTRRVLLEALWQGDASTVERLQQASITRGGVVLCAAMRQRSLLSTVQAPAVPARASRDGIAETVLTR